MEIHIRGGWIGIHVGGRMMIEILPNTHLWGYMFLFAGMVHLIVAMMFFAMDRDNPFIKLKQWMDKRYR
jgi:sugar phosphate permease